MSEKSNEVLSAEIQSLSKEVAELKGLFSAFQTNFVRADIYAVRHEELVSKVAKLEKDSENFKSDIDQARGAITFMKVAISLLTAAGTVLGALWWLRG